MYPTLKLKKSKRTRRGGFKHTLRKIEYWRKFYTYEYIAEKLTNEKYVHEITEVNERKIELIKRHEKIIKESNIKYTADELTERLCLLQTSILKAIKNKSKEEVRPWLINQCVDTFGIFCTEEIFWTMLLIQSIIFFNLHVKNFHLHIRFR